MSWQPDYRNIIAVAKNEKPARLPIYEHNINVPFIEKATSNNFGELAGGNKSDQREFFQHYCNFFRDMTYDTVSFEYCITSILPDGGALMGGKAGPIQTRQDFEKYPWDELPKLFWTKAEPLYQMLAECMPDGMKAIGGVGNGVFEISEDLVGLEHLAYMQIDDPELFADLYKKIGDLMCNIWSTFLQRHSDMYAVCRFGDDLGFKSGTLTTPSVIRDHIVPQYRRIVELIHAAGKPFLYHSCGCIFEVMDDIIATGINAKHSNEDAIAPFDTWIERYNDRIGLFGGIDVDLICQETPATVRQRVAEMGARFRQNARGYALGSGNSIPDYVPVDGYMAMIDAVRDIRGAESS